MTKIKNFFKKLGMIAFKSVFAVLMGMVLLSSFIVFALPVSILAGIDFVCQKFENKTTSKPKLEDIEIDSVKFTEQIEEKQDENELVQEKIKSDRNKRLANLSKIIAFLAKSVVAKATIKI